MNYHYDDVNDEVYANLESDLDTDDASQRFWANDFAGDYLYKLDNSTIAKILRYAYFERSRFLSGTEQLAFEKALYAAAEDQVNPF